MQIRTILLATTILAVLASGASADRRSGQIEWGWKVERGEKASRKPTIGKQPKTTTAVRERIGGPGKFRKK